MNNKYFNDYLDDANDSLDNALEEYLNNNTYIVKQAGDQFDSLLEDINRLKEETLVKGIDENTVIELMNNRAIDFIVEVLKIGFKLGYEEATR